MCRAPQEPMLCSLRPVRRSGPRAPAPWHAAGVSCFPGCSWGPGGVINPSASLFGTTLGLTNVELWLQLAFRFRQTAVTVQGVVRRRRHRQAHASLSTEQGSYLLWRASLVSVACSRLITKNRC